MLKIWFYLQISKVGTFISNVGGRKIIRGRHQGRYVEHWRLVWRLGSRIRHWVALRVSRAITEYDRRGGG